MAEDDRNVHIYCFFHKLLFSFTRLNVLEVNYESLNDVHVHEHVVLMTI